MKSVDKRGHTAGAVWASRRTEQVGPTKIGPNGHVFEGAPAQAPRRSPSVASALAAIDSPNAIPQLAMPNHGRCRWPLSDHPPGDAHLTLFCGNVCGEKTYCCGHHAISIGRATTQEERAHAAALFGAQGQGKGVSTAQSAVASRRAA